MVGKIKDLTGIKFGSLTALSCVGRDKFGNALWHCICDCGKAYYGSCGQLTSGGSLTCGKCPKNTYKVINDIVIGKTSSGEEFIFDLDDFELVKIHNWFMQDGYVRTNIGGKGVALHNMLIGDVGKLMVDHINRIRNDNRRINLRLANKSQNAINSKINSKNTSGYKGVSFYSKKGKYHAKIKYKRKTMHLGMFENPTEAAKAYNQKAIELFGEYAFLNVI